jgi:DUF1365 family protein
MAWPEHVPAVTWHGRQGAVRHAFRYSVDYVLIDPDARRGPRLFSRNRLNLASVHDRDHGGAPGHGAGIGWARKTLATRSLTDIEECRILLLTQPRFLGYVFNPVSFWLVYRGEALVAVIAEVSNTYGDRHSYLCHRPGFAAIGAGDSTTAIKLLHVSPFLEIAGGYDFSFDIRPDRIAIRIALRGGPEGLVATLAGKRRRMTSGAILVAAVRRPLGALRTVALIHWEALRLALKGARYRRRPLPPVEEIT